MFINTLVTTFHRQFLLILILIGAPLAWAEESPLIRLRIESSNPMQLAADLEREGFDVLRPAPDAVTLDVIASQASRQRLSRMGLEGVVVGIGRPYRDIERESAPLEQIPSGYPDIDGIAQTLLDAQTQFPELCLVVNLSHRYGITTFEGRDILAIKVSDQVQLDENEPSVMIVSNHHAREIVTPVIALYALDQLTTGYGSDPAVTQAVNENEIWIIPSANPDGYVHVMDVDNYWRKNRRVFDTGIGVDQNRNYPFGWSTACSGDTYPGSEIFKGPSPASEAETQLIMALSEDCHFAKILDYHSYGREALFDYACMTHPFDAYWQSLVEDLSTASGYGGSVRYPSADGEHYHWQAAMHSAFASLIETATSFQPTYANAQNEAAMVWPGIQWTLALPIPVWGRVTDGVTQAPLAAEISIEGQSFPNGEQIVNGGQQGRYHLFIPPGTYNLTFEATDREPQTHTIQIVEDQSLHLDVVMVRPCPGDLDGTFAVDVRDASQIVSAYGQSGGPEDLDGSGVVDLADVMSLLPDWGQCP